MAIKPQPSFKHLSPVNKTQKKQYVKWLQTKNVEVKVGWGVQTLHVSLHAPLPPTCLLNHCLIHLR